MSEIRSDGAGDTEARRFLEQCREQFDPVELMVVRPAASHGYHTRVARGAPVRDVRRSMDYAVVLLAAGDAEERQLAERILDRVVRLQDRDESSRTYGVWPYYLEEPLSEMNPPDWNWADFIGARLAHVVIEHGDKLADATLRAVREALGRATGSIVRRDVTADYTNIAVMGSGVAGAAGEALGVEAWIAYARRKLAAVEESVRRHGSFAEYNSPTYTLVALEEFDRILQLVRDEVIRASGQRLREVAWRCIADHWHPATEEWAGPHARAYSDRLTGLQRSRIARSPGLVWLNRPIPPDEELEGRPVKPRACPPELVSRFRRLPESPLEIRQRCQAGRGAMPDRIATTWFHEDGCLASFNRGHLWSQSRPLLAYWKVPGGCAVARARMLLDDRDLASAQLVQVQAGPRVLSAAHFWTGAGVHHPFFDVPEDGVFELSDLRLRISVDGDGSEVVQVREGVWALRAHGHQLIVHATPSRYGGDEIRWAEGSGDGSAWIDAVCHADKRTNVRLGETALELGFGVELLQAGGLPSALSPEFQVDGSEYVGGWSADRRMEVRAPLLAVPLYW